MHALRTVERFIQQLIEHWLGEVFMDHAIDFNHRPLIAGAKTVPPAKIGLILELMVLKVLFNLLDKLFVSAGKAGTTETYPYLYQNIF